MGLYDSVYIQCPNCGKLNEEQTKTGSSLLQEYEIDNAPADVLGGLDGREGTCYSCGLGYKIVVEVTAFVKPNW